MTSQVFIIHETSAAGQPVAEVSGGPRISHPRGASPFHWLDFRTDPEKVGAFGFSAGSHLTVLLATSALTPAYGPVDALDQLPCHVNWAVPIYTAYALTDGLAGPNTREGAAYDHWLDRVAEYLRQMNFDGRLGAEVDLMARYPTASASWAPRLAGT